LLGGDLVELAGPDAAARIEQGLAALATGAVGSYQGERTYPDCNGNPVHAQHTVSRLDLCDVSPVAVGVVTRRTAAGDVRPGLGGSLAPVLATLDHQGRVHTVGPDTEPGLLDLCPRRLLGDRLHEHVHPEDWPALSAALDLTQAQEVATTTLRLRSRAGWRVVDVLAGALCQHKPHRVGVLIGAHSASEPAGEHAEVPSVPVRTADELPSQQREVVTRLLRGENIATMASRMHLSRSTVRNHLSAVYSKAGVHSQAELIAHITGRRLVQADGNGSDRA
jgi:DNA-binding CsgD family transcriptional regulator